MNSTDKMIRLTIAGILFVLYFLNLITGITAIIALVLAAVLVVTGFLRFCPLYAFFKIKTN